MFLKQFAALRIRQRPTAKRYDEALLCTAAAGQQVPQNAALKGPERPFAARAEYLLHADSLAPLNLFVQIHKSLHGKSPPNGGLAAPHEP